jgi:hypothetical protein
LRSRLAWLALWALPVSSAWAIQVDGRIDPAEWQDAQHVTEFRKTQPLSGEPASNATEAWILATPEGLAVGFHNTQPASVPRTLQRVQRDFHEQVDRVNLVIDFDGDHRTGYHFIISSTDGVADSIVTNENNFNYDWDGNWQHAVASDAEGWTAEFLIPWHIAPMRQADGKRKLGIYLDRVVGSTGERAAWPYASFDRPRYLSDFAVIEVDNYSQSLLAITPYASGLYDAVGKASDGDAGVDVFWKPNGQVQLTATVNPDFGQVESDDLVVNFSATETFISDKRPFFTENQGIFEYTTPSDFSQLLYTRRVGGPADDGEGAGDIVAALKLNGSIGATKYGLFAADEAEEVGRTFAACATGTRLQQAEPGLHGDLGGSPVLRSPGDDGGRRSRLAADGALEHSHARVRQRHRRSRREYSRYRCDRLGRLRNGSRLAPAGDRHALRQRARNQ